MKTQKKKGNSFELKIAKLLSKKFDKQFSRTPNSGGFATINKNCIADKVLKEISGDIITPENFNYCIECKHGYDIELSQLLTDTAQRRLFISFIEECEKSLQNNYPLIIYQRNRRRPLACLYDSLIKDYEYDKMIIEHNKTKYAILDLEQLLKIEDKLFWGI